MTDTMPETKPKHRNVGEGGKIAGLGILGVQLWSNASAGVLPWSSRSHRSSTLVLACHLAVCSPT